MTIPAYIECERCAADILAKMDGQEVGQELAEVGETILRLMRAKNDANLGRFVREVIENYADRIAARVVYGSNVAPKWATDVAKEFV